MAIARMALSQLSFTTDTGEERAVIAKMLVDLTRELVSFPHVAMETEDENRQGESEAAQ